jgi:hypothetical protein
MRGEGRASPRPPHRPRSPPLSGVMAAARRCEEVGVDAFELNFSCPHGMPERKVRVRESPAGARCC